MFGLGTSRQKLADDEMNIAPAPGAALELAGATFAWAARGCEDGCDNVRVHQATAHRLVFMLLDIAGDRAGGALATQAASKIFAEATAELFAPADLNESEALSSFALKVNRAVMTEGRVHCAAAFLACYDAQTGALWYVNAGHTSGLVHDGAVHELSASGVPLGLFSHAIHDAQIAVLPPRSSFLLISKGVAEVRYRRQEFGLDGAKTVVARRDLNAPAMCEALLDAADEFADDRYSRHHDRTVIALVRR